MSRVTHINESYHPSHILLQIHSEPRHARASRAIAMAVGWVGCSQRGQRRVCATKWSLCSLLRCGVLHCVAVCVLVCACCSALQCVVACCSVWLQCVTGPVRATKWSLCSLLRCGVLTCVAVCVLVCACCSALQCVVACCSVWQCVAAVCYSACTRYEMKPLLLDSLWCAALCCIVL